MSIVFQSRGTRALSVKKCHLTTSHTSRTLDHDEPGVRLTTRNNERGREAHVFHGLPAYAPRRTRTFNLLIKSAGLAAKIRREVHRPLLVRFLVGTALGLPLGLFAFQRADGDQLMVVVSLVVLAFVAFLAFQRKVRAPATRDPSFRGWAAACVGALGGAMTIALGMPGPPIVLYLTRLGVRKDTLRATTLAFFAVSYSASLILQSAVVGVGREVWGSAAILVPVALGGGWIGNQLSCYVSEAVFRRAMLVLITLTGVSALAAALP